METNISAKELEKNIKTIKAIIDSDDDDFDKAYKISKIYNSVESFIKVYNPIYEAGRDIPWFRSYIESYPRICQTLYDYKHKKYFIYANSIKSIEKYLINLDYAKEIIRTFIISDHSHDFISFLEEMNITKEDFEFCVETIRSLNFNLAVDYDYKLEVNKLKRYKEKIDACKDVALGITTGYFSDGKSFDMLEFWRRIPFAGVRGTIDFKECMELNPYIENSNHIFGKINNFTKVAVPETNGIITNFTSSNNIYRINCVSELELRRLCGSTKRFIKKIKDASGRDDVIDVTLTDEDFENIIRYMRINKLPYLVSVFYLVLDKYASGEIILDNIIKQSNDNKHTKILH